MQLSSFLPGVCLLVATSAHYACAGPRPNPTQAIFLQCMKLGQGKTNLQLLLEILPELARTPSYPRPKNDKDIRQVTDCIQDLETYTKYLHFDLIQYGKGEIPSATTLFGWQQNVHGIRTIIKEALERLTGKDIPITAKSDKHMQEFNNLLSEQGIEPSRVADRDAKYFLYPEPAETPDKNDLMSHDDELIIAIRGCSTALHLRIFFGAAGVFLGEGCVQRLLKEVDQRLLKGVKQLHAVRARDLHNHLTALKTLATNQKMQRDMIDVEAKRIEGISPKLDTAQVKAVQDALILSDYPFHRAQNALTRNGHPFRHARDMDIRAAATYVVNVLLDITPPLSVVVGQRPSRSSTLGFLGSPGLPPLSRRTQSMDEHSKGLMTLSPVSSPTRTLPPLPRRKNAKNWWSSP